MTSRRQKEMQEYWQSKELAKMTADMIEMHKGRCQRCFNKRGRVVHHLSYENFKNETYEDVMLLCRRCHAIVHGKIKEYYEGERNKKKANKKPKKKRKMKESFVISTKILPSPTRTKPSKPSRPVKSQERINLEETIKRSGIKPEQIRNAIMGDTDTLRSLVNRLIECNKNGIKFTVK